MNRLPTFQQLSTTFTSLKMFVILSHYSCIFLGIGENLQQYRTFLAVEESLQPLFQFVFVMGSKVNNVVFLTNALGSGLMRRTDHAIEMWRLLKSCKLMEEPSPTVIEQQYAKI